MIVVSDTSPLNYLILVDVEDVLPVLFGTVLAPPAVLLEMQHPKTPEKVREWATRPPPWLEVRTPHTNVQMTRLGLGESEAIALAVETRADKLLIDDREALAIARSLGLSCLGTIAVLDLAADEGLVDISTVRSALEKTSFHASPSLIQWLTERDEARRRPREDPT